jgi:hypothetical protein
MFEVAGGVLLYNNAVFARLVKPGQSDTVSSSEQAEAIEALHTLEKSDEYELEPLD